MPELATPAGVGLRGLSLVIPVSNEHGTIRRTIREADAALGALAEGHEIVVVDDGSTDGTADVVREEAAANPRVRLVQHPGRRGYGEALRAGLRAAATEVIAFAGPGGLPGADELRHLLILAREHDVVCGHLNGGPRPVHRRLCRAAYAALVGVLAGTRANGPGAALTVLRRGHLDALLPQSENAFAATEVPARARLEGLRAVEVALPAGPPRPGGDSPRELPGALAALLRFWWSRTLFPAPDAAVAGTAAGSWAALAVLALLAGALLFGNLSYPLLEPDEGRYAEVVREMVSGGDWLVPRLNDAPFYDKPPLFYWLVAGSYRLFGVNEWAARAVPALAAWLTVLAVFGFGRRLAGTRPAFLAALVLTLTAGFVLCGRIVILDSLLTLFVTAALFAGHEAVRGGRLRRGWWAASAACCALGVLTKGPIAAVLLVPPLAAHAWLVRSPARPRPRHWAAYGALALGLAAPPYVATIVRSPQFAYHFFVDQHLVRFLMPEYHVRPFWYFLPVLLVAGLPWSFLALPLARFLFHRGAEARALRPAWLGFLLLWAGWCVLFFSASSSKLPPYILPALPAAALLAGYYLDVALFRGLTADAPRPAVPRLAAVVLCGVGLAGVAAAWRWHLVGPVPSLLQAAVAAGGLVVLLVWGARLPCRAAWSLCGVLGALVIFVAAQEIIPAWSRSRSPLTRFEELGRMVREEHVPVACCEGEWGSVPFYLGRTAGVTNLTGLTPEVQVLKAAGRPRQLLVVRHKDDLERFRQALAPLMTMTRVLYAGEIGVGLLEATPEWKQVLEEWAAHRLPDLPSTTAARGPNS
jgi:dolichol-phosphate mannosyltransferase